mmetsp:Transcript_3932/g.10914  ORF Transcript_3932/g.10914 Transcript_3932/m.10914 type:complete len:257 (+) Transcript_3932:113-883(+)|eukprot:CAMPEP_0119137510 /NCGR_PEP_ID=MMETSP1310-20130426/23723_1 /TAXON_ID=464262 /ORGANISM="Genus nov. species nov., Strain RCC2339" /LENGTH=256 /DNA_ID=CAMNT_0007128603 /DNA_START=78 /DNA_END=848 /DNA_ORIENTATION=-
MVLRNLLFVSGSGGMVLFEKSWGDPAVLPTKILSLGGVLTSVQEFARQIVGYQMAYVEFEGVAMTLAKDEASELQCVLFHDVEDGSLFGRLVSNQLLCSFLEEFADIDFSRGIHDTGRFMSFGSKVKDSLRDSVEAILLHLASQRGYTQAIMVYNNGQTQTGGEPGLELGLAANLQPLLAVAGSMLVDEADAQDLIFVESTSNVVLVYRLPVGNLVSVCKKGTRKEREIRRDVMVEQTKSSALLIEKVFEAMKKIQ